MTIRKKWTKHLIDNNVSYTQHMTFAIKCSFDAIKAGLCLLIHSIFPCYFQKTGSTIIRQLSEKFKH